MSQSVCSPRRLATALSPQSPVLLPWRHLLRRAKIVATLGPATSSYETVRALIEAGVDVARLNLSHGDYSVHDANYANVRRASEDTGRAVAVLVDLQGPKIRLGKFERGRTSSPSATSSRSPPRTSWQPRDLRHDLQGTAERRQPWRLPARRRRQGTRRGRRDRWHGGHHARRRSPAASRQQGHQPARRRGQRSGAEREGRGRSPLGIGHRRRSDRAVVRTQRRRRRAGARDHGRRGRGRSRDRRRSRSRRPSTHSRRSSMPSTASWSPVETWAWSCPWKQCRSCRSARSNSLAATRSRSSSPRRCSSR